MSFFEGESSVFAIELGLIDTEPLKRRLDSPVENGLGRHTDRIVRPIDLVEGSHLSCRENTTIRRDVKRKERFKKRDKPSSKVSSEIML